MQHKKILLLMLLVFSIHFLLFTRTVIAQYRSESNKVTTRVGNPADTSGPRPTAPPCPNNNCRQAVIDEFGVTISTAFPADYALYAWEKLWNVSNTNFDELVSGTYVERQDSGSERKGNTIYLRGTYGREFFYIIFVHEMGHVINDMDDPVSLRTRHNNLWNQIGGLTGYGKTACLYDPPTEAAMKEENYADLIAYYLNPEAPDQTTNDCSTGIVVFANGANRDYFELGRDILGAY